MTPVQIVFILASVLLLGAAVFVVSSEKVIHSALWLIVSLFGVAVLFALLQVGFFAVIQVVVYIGAIATLFIFAVMLTRQIMEDRGPQLTRWWWAAGLAAVGVYGTLVMALRSWDGFMTPITEIQGGGQELVGMLGQLLSYPDFYLLPFEVASVLLLAALIGSIYIASDKH